MTIIQLAIVVLVFAFIGIVASLTMAAIAIANLIDYIKKFRY